MDTAQLIRGHLGRAGAGAGGTPEPYQSSPGVRPFTAEGAELRLTFRVTNRVTHSANRDLRQVHTVPDPFYLRSTFDESQSIRFVNLPDRAIIRIYSSRGVLVRVLEHQSAVLSGEALWDLTNRSGQRVAGGVYFYHVEASNGRRVGRLTVGNYPSRSLRSSPEPRPRPVTAGALSVFDR